MKLATTETGYESLLKKLLQAIDAAPLGDSNSFFKKLDDKEFYETQIMFAVRKRHTAKYHCENVARQRGHVSLLVSLGVHDCTSKSSLPIETPPCVEGPLPLRQDK